MGGIISSMSWIYLLGYLIVIIGVVIGGWLSANYFSTILEKKHPERIKELLF